MTTIDTETVADASIETTTNPTLDSRIAEALGNEGTDRDSLIGLWQEAHAAIDAAKQVVEIESARALDIENSNPEESDELVRKAQRTVDRLTKAINRLKIRVDRIDADAYAKDWHAEADRLKAERDKLADELVSLYPQFVAQIAALFERIDANTTAISDLHVRVPYGEPRRLADAEQSARGLQYSAETPPLRDNLRLPDWVWSRELAFPAQLDFNAFAAAALQQSQAALVQKFALTHGPDWAAAKELQEQQQRAETAQRDAQLAAEAAEKRREFEQSLIEADRRRRLGITTEAS